MPPPALWLRNTPVKSMNPIGVMKALPILSWRGDAGAAAPCGVAAIGVAAGVAAAGGAGNAAAALAITPDGALGKTVFTAGTAYTTLTVGAADEGAEAAVDELSCS